MSIVVSGLGALLDFWAMYLYFEFQKIIINSRECQKKVLMLVLDRQVLGLFTKNSLGGETQVVLGGLPIYLNLFTLSSVSD